MERITSDSYRQYPEHERSLVENPKIIARLGSAGLTAVDLQLFDRLHQQNHSIFVHGSIIADRITPRSDIDFTIIGEASDMPQELRDTLMPGLSTAEELCDVDYISTSIQSQSGRKISMHISEPLFRENYPVLDTPYATEYRPAKHAKKGARKYFLPGTTRDGEMRLINFMCESETVGDDAGTLTDIPQTGVFTLKGSDVYIDGKVKSNMVASEVIRLSQAGDLQEEDSLNAEEVMILGLEFDKMQSDTSMYKDSDAELRFVERPTVRSLKAVGEFTKTDPNIASGRMLDALAQHWSKVKPNKSR